jgi:hypothetical protein
MAIPQVICSADVVLDHSASAQAASLGAEASPGPITAWRWTILAVPEGSTAHIGSKGSFTDGIATAQNPTLLCDAGIDGGYTVQCMATNADGDSDPMEDREEGQQLVIVRTEAAGLWLPGDYSYDWGRTYLDKTLRALETHVPDHHAEHENGGGDEISVSGLSGTLADPQDAGSLDGQPLGDLSGASEGDVLTYTSGEWVPGVSSADSPEKTVKVTVGAIPGNYDSAYSVPVGTVVKRCTVKVETNYNGSATLAVKVNGSSALNLQLSTENNPALAHDYQTEPNATVQSGYSGVIRVTVGGTPTVGAATVLIELCEVTES